MLLPLLICILILYLPPPYGAIAPWPVVATGVVLLVLLNALASWVGARLAVRVASGGPTRGALAGARVFALLKGGVVGFIIADVFALKWPVLVGDLFAGSRWLVLADDLFLLLPALVMVLTVMAFRHGYESRLGHVSLPLGRYLWLRFRVEMAMILAPWLSLVLVTDLVAALFYGSAHAETADMVASGAVLVLIVVFSPLLLRAIWRTAPLADGPLRQRLEAMCRSLRFRCHNILVWHTHNHLANAGVVGPTPLLRYVVLSDALLRHCDEAEVEAVFAHEVGHVRRHHLSFYMLFAVAFVCFNANLMDLLASLGWGEPLGDILAFSLTTGQAIVVLLFAGFYWIFLFGLLSRRMELEADLFSIRSVANPAAFLSALAKLAAIGNVPARLWSWRHFSIERRVRFLRGVLAEPSKAAGFQWKIRMLKVMILSLFGLGLFRLLLKRPELFGL